MRTAYALPALSQSGDRYEPRPANGDVCLRIGLSVKSSYWQKLTSVRHSDSGHAGLSRRTKYVRHASTRRMRLGTSTIYRFCFTKFMREMVRINKNTPHELQQMLQELADESKNQGLKMNNSKTKVMIEYDPPIYVQNTRIESIKSYICLGRMDSIRQAQRHLQG